MKSFKDLAQEIVNKVDEDAPANAVGTGANVALPPTHEPGVMKKKKKKHDPILINNLKRKVQENNDNNSMMLKGVLDKLEELDNIVDEASGVKKNFINDEVETKKEYLSFKDKYMGELLNETSTAKATKSEQAICVAHNMLKNNVSVSDIRKKIQKSGRDENEETLTAVNDAGIDTREWEKVSNNIRAIGVNVANNIQSAITQKLVHSGRDMTGTNQFAVKLNKSATDTTPKTDIMTADGTRRFSLKSSRGAQLLSPRGGEASGVVEVAIKNAGLGESDNEDLKKVTDFLENTLNNLTVKNLYVEVGNAKSGFLDWYLVNRKEDLKKYTTDEKKLEKHMKTELAPYKVTNYKSKSSDAYKNGLIDKNVNLALTEKEFIEYLEGFVSSKVINKDNVKNFAIPKISDKGKQYLNTPEKEANARNPELIANNIKDLLKVAMEQATFKDTLLGVLKNDELKKWIVYEGATGQFKFNGQYGVVPRSGGNNAVANEMMTFAENGNTIIHKNMLTWATQNKDIVIKKLLIDFKGSTSALEKYTKFGIGVEPKDIAQEIQVIADSYEYKSAIHEYLSEIKQIENEYEFLDEGFIDFIKRGYTSVADTVRKVATKIKEITKKLYEKVIKMVINKIIDLAKKGFNVLLKTLGFEITATIQFA